MTAILFHSLFPAVWVLILSVPITLLFAWLEAKRAQKLLIPRLVALLFAIASLACLALSPVSVIRKSSDIILLTKDFSKKILDSLLLSNSASQVYQLAGAEAGNAIVEIRNYRELGELNGNLYILGQGMPSYMLDYLDTSALQFFPAAASDGFIQINTHNKYAAHQPAAIEGIFQSNTPSKIKLTGPGISEDSIQLKANSPQPFSLTFTPKTAGLYTYTLTSSDSSGNIIHSEQLPVEVKDQKALTIMIVTDYPSAEIRFLKNFLGSQNHKVIVRYRISKDKYRTEFTNTPQRPAGRLQESLLKEIDLVITDVSGFSSLSHAEVEELQSAERFGLGSLILFNTPDLPKSVKNYLDLDVTGINQDSAHLVIHKKSLKVQATPVRISANRKLSAIQQETGGRIVSGYRTAGLGKAGFQILDNTYALSLAGENETYAYIWSGVVEALARNVIKKYDLRFTSPPPYFEDEPVEFTIVASAEKPTVILESMEIPLAEDPLVKNVWHGKIWTDQAGWHTLDIRQDSSRHNFFLSPVDAWNSIRINNQQQALQQFVSRETEGPDQLVHQQIPPWIFFVLFILSAGFLWLSPKL